MRKDKRLTHVRVHQDVDLMSMETKKSAMLVWRCHQLLYGFLNNGHLPRVLCQLRLSKNKDDNDVKPGAVHRSFGNYLAVEENTGKPQLGDCLKAVRTVIASNVFPNLQMISVGLHGTSERERERERERRKEARRGSKAGKDITIVDVELETRVQIPIKNHLFKQ